MQVLNSKLKEGGKDAHFFSFHGHFLLTPKEIYMYVYVIELFFSRLSIREISCTLDMHVEKLQEFASGICFPCAAGAHHDASGYHRQLPA